MSKFTLAFSNGGSIIPPDVPELSDLVSLGILTKQVSEFTDADIGSIISIPYTDASGNITGPIEFEVVGVNHHKDINDESKPTITLMTKNIIRYATFDGKEPNNSDGNKARGGNNRWSVSNIRQWLNSEGAANEWFTAQHEYDTAPDTTNMEDIVLNDPSTEYGAYADDPGFLVGFSDEIKQHFATVKNKTVLCSSDEIALSKEYEETEDKVFLPSYTEMGFGDLDSSNPEGSHITKFNSNELRLKTGANGCYWMRSPNFGNGCLVYYVNGIGGVGTEGYAFTRYYGIAPILVLC